MVRARGVRFLLSGVGFGVGSFLVFLSCLGLAFLWFWCLAPERAQDALFECRLRHNTKITLDATAFLHHPWVATSSLYTPCIYW